MFARGWNGYPPHLSEHARPDTGQDDTAKDAYPPDSQFGRTAARDAERADREGEEARSAVAEHAGEVRAADKAEPEAERDIVDEQSEESFPASDPPSTR